MDLTKIKELAASHERTHTGPDDLRRMADAVPYLLWEIERLKGELSRAQGAGVAVADEGAL